jgi:hypothetical protein
LKNFACNNWFDNDIIKIFCVMRNNYSFVYDSNQKQLLKGYHVDE